MKSIRIQTGASETKITPAKNIPLSGYESRKTGSQGTKHDLFARALVFDNSKARLGIIVAELIGFPAATTEAIKERAAKELNIPPENLIISCTHTHSGPDTKPKKDVKCPQALNPSAASARGSGQAAHGRFLEKLPDKLFAVLEKASKRARPSKLVYGRAVVEGIGHNRRYRMKDGTAKMDWEEAKKEDISHYGPIDPGLHVLAVKRGKSVKAALMNHACHATVMGESNFLITPDWPGAACRKLKEGLGGKAVALMAQGTCGDINPAPPRDSFEVVEEKGAIAATAALRAIEKGRELTDDALKGVMVPLELPRREDKDHPHHDNGGGPWKGYIQALRIGELVIVALPGEVFVEIGLAIKAACESPHVMVIGYANDYGLGYVPTTDAFRQGGYEPTTARVGEGADALMIAAAKKAIQEVTK